MKYKYQVIIVTKDEGEVVSYFNCKSKMEANAIERGVNINLDHKNYYTEIQNYEEVFE
jgi:hypothetical protein